MPREGLDFVDGDRAQTIGDGHQNDAVQQFGGIGRVTCLPKVKQGGEGNEQ